VEPLQAPSWWVQWNRKSHPVDSYLAEVLPAIRPLTPLQLGLDESDGAMIAEDITKGSPLPNFDNSAIGGYAIRLPVVRPSW
jgi:molybdopterin biosynthesis enzyme